MEFPRQEYWSELPFPSPEDLPDPGIKPAFLVSPALAGGLFTTVPPQKAGTTGCIGQVVILHEQWRKGSCLQPKGLGNKPALNGRALVRHMNLWGSSHGSDPRGQLKFKAENPDR